MVPRCTTKVSEKRKPHYNLEELKELVRKERWIVTRKAEMGAVELGFSHCEIREIILNLRREDFYKSMTSYRNHKLWQDVYKPRVLSNEEYIELYLKLQKSSDEKCVVISFKRSEDYDDV